VQVVGYDNNRQAWLIKNSWGPGFADKGFGWVGFDALYICDPGGTYGLAFEPYVPPDAAIPRQEPASGGNKGCCVYTAVAGDYPDALSLQFDVRLQQLLLDNLDVISDPSVVPAGTRLLLCGGTWAGLAGVAGGSTCGTAAAAAAGAAGGAAGNLPEGSTSDELGPMMAIRRALDPPGAVLKDWQLDSQTPCGWSGVVCDPKSNRVTKIFNWEGDEQSPKVVQLSGQLPSGRLLARLRGLVSIVLVGSKGLTGTLPEDWSQLEKLKVVNLSGNRLTGAPLCLLAVGDKLLSVLHGMCKTPGSTASPLLCQSGAIATQGAAATCAQTACWG
jgi:hypothetical protein